MDVLREPVLAPGRRPARVVGHRGTRAVAPGEVLLVLRDAGGDVEVRAPRPGVFVPRVDAGWTVKPGEVLGWVDVPLERLGPVASRPLEVVVPALLGLVGGLVVLADDPLGWAPLLLGTLSLLQGARSRLSPTARSVPARLRAAVSALHDLGEGRPVDGLPAPRRGARWRPVPEDPAELAAFTAREDLPPGQLEMLARHPAVEVAALAAARLAGAKLASGADAVWSLYRRPELEVRVAALRAIGGLEDRTSLRLLEQLATERPWLASLNPVQRAVTASRARLRRRFGESDDDDWRPYWKGRDFSDPVVAAGRAGLVAVPLVGLIARIGFEMPWETLAWGVPLLCALFVGLPAFVLTVSTEETYGVREPRDGPDLLVSGREDRRAGSLAVVQDPAEGGLSELESEGQVSLSESSREG